MLGVLSFVEDPDLSWTGGPAVPQLLPPCQVAGYISDKSETASAKIKSSPDVNFSLVAPLPLLHSMIT